VGGGFVQSQALHQDAFGAIDQLPRLQALRGGVAFIAKGFRVGESSKHDRDLGGERFTRDGFDEISEHAGGGGSGMQCLVAVGADDDDRNASQRQQLGRKLDPVGGALVAVQAFSTGQSLTVDARLAGVFAGVVALLCKAPFLVVVAVAAVTTALLRLYTG